MYFPADGNFPADGADWPADWRGCTFPLMVVFPQMTRIGPQMVVFPQMTRMAR
jgi:hypothetical protein